MTKRVAALAALIAVTAQPAAADEFIFKGDCERARIVRSERTIDKIMPYNTYRGIQRINYGDDECGRDAAMFYDLTMRERSTTRMVYGMKRKYFKFFTKKGTCGEAQLWNELIGTVTFDLRMKELGGGLCELYAWSDWQQEAVGFVWKSNFANRMVPTDGGSFVMTQGAPSQTQYFTPLSFSGSLF